MAAEDLKKFDAQIAAIAGQEARFRISFRCSPKWPGNVPPTFLFHRGDHRQPKRRDRSRRSDGLCRAGRRGWRSPPRIPRYRPPAVDWRWPSWLAGDNNPLTARVLVNRVWLNHFGRGLVNTPADFGALGEKPSHPELLDWLAATLIAGGWKLKRLHRMIMTSTAYRQASSRDRE